MPESLTIAYPDAQEPIFSLTMPLFSRLSLCDRPRHHYRESRHCSRTSHLSTKRTTQTVARVRSVRIPSSGFPRDSSISRTPTRTGSNMCVCSSSQVVWRFLTNQLDSHFHDTARDCTRSGEDHKSARITVEHQLPHHVRPAPRCGLLPREIYTMVGLGGHFCATGDREYGGRLSALGVRRTASASRHRKRMGTVEPAVAR